MEPLRRVARFVMLRVDRLYQRWRRLQPVGEVLVAGRDLYRGDARRFADGTRLAPGDPIGTLHFQNARISRLDGATSRRAAAQFARLFLDSLGVLAARARDDRGLADLVAYRAVSWLPPLPGARVGFVTQPFPEGMRKRLLALYFHFLIWAFAPARETREAIAAEPTIFWITRAQLLGRASDDPARRGSGS